MKKFSEKIWKAFMALPSKYKLLALGLVCIVLGIGICSAILKEDKEVVYREVTVEYGSLVVGIEKSGAVDIGTIEQTFELDMSALQKVETNSASGNSLSGGFGGASSGMPGMGSMFGGRSAGGGMNMFNQMFNVSGNGVTNTAGAGASLLEIEEVCVSVGQQIEEGDVLYRLESSGVEKLSSDLEGNVTKAEADLNALIADQKLSKVIAENTYQTNIAYGSYAATEKNSTISGLQQAVNEKEKALAVAQENVTTFKTQLEQAQYDYNLAKENLEKCTWSLEHEDKEDVFGYTYYFGLVEEATALADSAEQSLEKIESNLEQAEKNVETCQKELSKAQRSLASGILTAQETYELRMLAYNNAQETYDITLAYLEDDLAEQEKIYAEAKEKWDEFSSHIDGTEVRAKNNGIITSVNLTVGDSLTTDATIVTLYDLNEVSMTVTLDEEDMDDITEGSLANISLTAYPNDIYKAVVSEISDASSDSSGNTTYDVTVTLQGDVSGLFQGMTGNITFITKEMEEVKYVSNRAITRKGTKSYVKIKDANGSIKKQEVITGFSDGVSVEIVEGLEVGDVVLIESKVAEK